MFLKKLMLIYFLFIRIKSELSNQGCTDDICWQCFFSNMTIFLNCICSNCPPLKSECSSYDCKLCKDTPDIESIFHCLCNTCDEKKEIVKYIFTIIGIGLGIILIFVLCFCCIRHNLTENIGSNNNNAHRNIIIDNNNDIDINILPIDDLLTNEKYLGPKKCKKEYEKYNIECTICLQKFKDDIDMVSLTPCYHLFHNKCLYIYFKKNKMAKCPNCKFDILNHYKKKS